MQQLKQTGAPAPGNPGWQECVTGLRSPLFTPSKFSYISNVCLLWVILVSTYPVKQLKKQGFQAHIRDKSGCVKGTSLDILCRTLILKIRSNKPKFSVFFLEEMWLGQTWISALLQCCNLGICLGILHFSPHLYGFSVGSQASCHKLKTYICGIGL